VDPQVAESAVAFDETMSIVTPTAAQDVALSQGSGASRGVGRHTVSYGEEPADHSRISREEGPKGGRCVAALVGAAALTATEN